MNAEQALRSAAIAAKIAGQEAAERRRYALLQAAAILVVGDCAAGFNLNLTECVQHAEDLLGLIEKREKEQDA